MGSVLETLVHCHGRRASGVHAHGPILADAGVESLLGLDGVGRHCAVGRRIEAAETMLSFLDQVGVTAAMKRWKGSGRA